MTRQEVEAWAVNVLLHLKDGGNLEDRNVELKSSWPDPAKAARRLAGQANAARGQILLWMIGVHENGFPDCGHLLGVRLVVRSDRLRLLRLGRLSTETLPL